MNSESKPKSASVFQETTFKGKVSAGAIKEDVIFVAYAGDDCRLIVSPLRVSGKTYIELTKCVGCLGGFGEDVTLTGQSSDGIEFSSQYMEVEGYNSGTNGYEIRLEAREATITFPRKSNPENAAVGLKLALRGFKGFPPCQVQAQLGRVVVQGSRKITSPDDVCGVICVLCPEERPDENWYQNADKLAEFVWKGLQFGHGGQLQVPLLQEFRPDEVIATFYNGFGRPAHLPAIHFLGQSEFVSALVAHFESENSFPDAVWQAVGWLNSDSSIDEVRYLALMTAVETLLHSLVPDAPSSLLERDEFKPIRCALIQTLAGFELSREDEEILKGNIQQINRAPLSRKLKAMVEKYGLAFDEKMIQRLNKQRNSIVHNGKSLDRDDELRKCILDAREMITLIVFSELGYKGSYNSYVGDYELRTNK